MACCKDGTAEKRTVVADLSPAKPIAANTAAFTGLFQRFRGDELLETRIIPERIEHWIEPEQRGCKWHV
jgi:hypothetical protein